MTTRWMSRHRMALVGAVSLVMGLLLAANVGSDFNTTDVFAAVLSSFFAFGGAILVYLDLRLPRHEVWSVSLGVKLPLYGALLLLAVVAVLTMRPLLSGSTATFSAPGFTLSVSSALAAVLCGALHLFATQREYDRRATQRPPICTRCRYPRTDDVNRCSECGQPFV